MTLRVHGLAHIPMEVRVCPGCSARFAGVNFSSSVALSDLAESKSSPTLFLKSFRLDGPESLGAATLIAEILTADMNLIMIKSSSSASDCRKLLGSSRSPAAMPRQCRSVWSEAAFKHVHWGSSRCSLRSENSGMRNA